MTYTALTDYDVQADHFIKLPEYSIASGTDYLAVKEVPGIIKNIQPLSKILDLGCGTGLATRYLKQHFPNVLVVGADINKNMLEQASKADPKGIYVHLNYSEGQIYYPFLSNTFDVVVCSFMLHENKTLNELNLLIKNIKMLLRADGLFLGWDVYKNLIQGQWTTIKILSTHSSEIQDGEPYTASIAPGNAVVTGTYWSPQTIHKIAAKSDFQTIMTDYPIIDDKKEAASTAWLDETKYAPYFVISARKK